MRAGLTDRMSRSAQSHALRGWQRLCDLPQIVVDTVIAAGMAGVTMWIGTEYHVPGYRSFGAEAFALTALTNAPLALRRQIPVPVLLASCAALAWFVGSGYMPSFNLFGPLLAMYGVAALRRPRTAAVAATVTMLTILYSCLATGVYTVPTSLAQALLTTGIAWVFGTGSRELADRNQRLLELADELRQEREERARAAVAEERVRIARELHDVVAHHMSVVSVQAGTARYVLPTDPQTAGTALDVIADSSHEALEEMRRLLSVLRVDGDGPEEHADGTSYTPAPGLARLGDLIARVQAAGVPVELTVVGSVRALAPSLDLCVYRVIQESLTNVLKHARHTTRVVLQVEYRTDGLAVRVANDGPGAPCGPGTGRREPSGGGSPGSSPGAGRNRHGLIGMRERARLYGGTVTAEPGPQGGFTVTLHLPLPAAPPTVQIGPAVPVDPAPQVGAVGHAPSDPLDRGVTRPVS